MRTLMPAVGLVLLLAIPCHAHLTSFTITSSGHCVSGLSRLGPDALAVYGQTNEDPARLWYATGTQRGASWAVQQTAVPAGLDLSSGYFSRLHAAVQPGHLGCLGATRAVAPEVPRAMPLWYCLVTGKWLDGVLTDAITAGIRRREVLGLFAQDPTGTVCWAGGCETLADGAKSARLWKSLDGGKQWFAVPSGAGASDAIRLLDRTPGYGIWGVGGGSQALWIAAYSQPTVKLVGGGVAAVLALSSPTDDEAWVCGSAQNPPRPPYTLHYTPNRFANLQQVATMPGEPVAMDFLNNGFGMVGLCQAGTPVTYAVSYTRDWGRTWSSESLGGRFIRGIDVVSTTEAYILADDGRGTYCLRWEPDLGPGHSISMTDRSGARAATDLPTPTAAGMTSLANMPASPILWWVGTGVYANCGVSPTTGPTDQPFMFKIVYQHPANKPPRQVLLHLFGRSAPFVMSGAPLPGKSYADGVTYAVTLAARTLAPGRYMYKFTANDGSKDAAGPPACWDYAHAVTVTR